MKRNKKGFTIVELVIVIGVIGILSAILIPTFANLTSKARAAEIKSNISNAYSAYVADLAEGADLLGQEQVVVEYKDAENLYVFKAGEGPVEDSTAAKKTPENRVYFVDQNGNDTYDAGVDIGIFEKAAA